MLKEVRILLVSDLHDSQKGIEKIKNWVTSIQPQVIISAGDLVSLNNPEQIDLYQSFLEAVVYPEREVWAIEGNNERPETVEWMKKQNIYFTTKQRFRHRWIGIGGWGENLSHFPTLDPKTILITHIPPAQVGPMRNMPKFHFFGHLHRPFFRKKIGNTVLIQIPPLMWQQAVQLTLPKGTIKLLD